MGPDFGKWFPEAPPAGLPLHTLRKNAVPRPGIGFCGAEPWRKKKNVVVHWVGGLGGVKLSWHMGVTCL